MYRPPPVPINSRSARASKRGSGWKSPSPCCPLRSALRFAPGPLPRVVSAAVFGGLSRLQALGRSRAGPWRAQVLSPCRSS
jgi:hypothetical protein